MIKLKYVFTSALLVAAASASQAVSRQQMQKQIDKDAPAYTIQGKDSICQIFIYSPAPNQGLHLAYFTDDERWVNEDSSAPATTVRGELKRRCITPSW